MLKLKTNFILIFSLIFLVHISFALCQAQDGAENSSIKQKVDALFADVNNNFSPGASLVVIKDGNIIYKQGYGIADIENLAQIAPSTVFHVGSVSKQFTAMAIQLLVQEGKISLDDDVRKYLPELHNFGKTITVRHLINHTSGLREQLQLLFMAGWRLEDVMTREDLLRFIWRQRELNYEPGAEYLYSNTNYLLLALIVERISGKPFAEYTKEKIFKPLGMKNTRFRDDYRMVTKNLALSYIPTSQGFKHMFLAGSYAGSTGLMTTAEDLALWDQNFYSAQVGGREVIGRMLTKGKLNNGQEINYASGLHIGQYRRLKTIEHSGEDAGYLANFLQFPEQHFSVIILSNAGGLDLFDLSRRIAEIYLANEIKAAQFTAPSNTSLPSQAAINEMNVSPQTLSSYANDYKLPFGIPFKLSMESGKLNVQVRQQAKQPLPAISATEFSTKDGSVRIKFLPPQKGKYIKLTVNIHGQQLDGELIETITLTEPAAKKYTGTYYSEELGSLYSISYKNGSLILSHRRGEEPLAIKHEDEFTTGFSAEARRWRSGEYVRIKFLSDRRNQITGFRFSMPSARNIRFVKSNITP